MVEALRLSLGAPPALPYCKLMTLDLDIVMDRNKKSHGISVYYQNVQGLIPFGNLSERHPILDNTKISELHAYVYRCYYIK